MTQQLPEEIQLTLLLSGGQQYTIAVETDSLLLQQLFEVIMDWEGKRARRLFQIPISNGQAVLAFPCDRLIGLITEPPLIIQQQLPDESVALEDQEMPLIDNPGFPNPLVAASTPEILPSPYVQLNNFLTSDEHQRLLNYVLEQKAAFVPTATSTGDLEYRQSLVLYNFPEFAELISDRIQMVLPDVLTKLDLPLFLISQIESQLTAHNDGHYYRIHNDNGSPDTASRVLTYIYYFYREPKPFSGGELRLYDSKVENNFYVQADSFKDIEPRNNSIVFILSRYLHEVLPIHCPSKAFADSRFTVNGWIRR